MQGKSPNQLSLSPRRYAYGAQSVKCAVCNFVTQARLPPAAYATSPVHVAHIMSLGGTSARREERHRRCLHLVWLVVRLPHHLPLPPTCALAARSREVVPQGTGLNRGLKWSLWRTLRRWTTKGKWRVRAHSREPCCRAVAMFPWLTLAAAGVQYGRRRGAKVKSSASSKKRPHRTIFDLRRMRCSARWPFSGTCQCNVACVWRREGSWLSAKARHVKPPTRGRVP